MSEVQHSFPITGNGEMSFYIGPKPPMGIVAFEPSDPYCIPGKKTNMLKTIPDYKSNCFMEIAVSLSISVTEEVSLGLAKQEKKATDYLLNEVEKEKPTYTKVLDTICGLVGLRFHRQFILKPLVENSFIGSVPVPVSNFVGDFAEVLEPVTLTQFGLDSLKSHLELFCRLDEKGRTDVSRVFQWLLRAWRERDHVAKFLYLFIPLECILGSSDEIDEETKKSINSLRNLVATSDDVEKNDLLILLDRIESRFAPTLISRFEAFAQTEKIEGWEADIKAFKKYNRTRNLLLHAGKANVQSHLNIDQEARTLEDLVERYVAVYVFGNSGVYASKWRPVRGNLTKVD
ncbi:MAG: hypothetical protein NT140_01650 [Deltaproteobacteria bacterium]|nr:hypothetical protein [Deltaproteobacteria bacterium]